MPTEVIDGIETCYEVIGTGPPLLMYSPGGFNAVIQAWSMQSIYAKVKFLNHLPKVFSCIMFDRRECGQSGGRVESITWQSYVAQGKGLLDHLGIKRAHLIGGCMGCSPVAAFSVTHPQMVASLFWPVGGPKYRMLSHQRFAEHLGFVRDEGLSGVIALVAKDGKTFGADPRGGPWASVIKRNTIFATAYAKQNVTQYCKTCEDIRRTLFDRDTAPGAEPEDLMRLDTPALIIPGHDASHATSAARYLEECLPRSDYWDIPAEQQTEGNVSERVMEFLGHNNTRIS